MYYQVTQQVAWSLEALTEPIKTASHVQRAYSSGGARGMPSHTQDLEKNTNMYSYMYTTSCILQRV